MNVTPKWAIVWLLLLGLYTQSSAQIVTLNPPLPGADDTGVTLTFDASEGTAGLVGAQKVYMHSGVVIAGPNGTDWQYVKGNWGDDDGIGEMTKVEGETDKWQITFNPDIRSYYEVPNDVNVFRLAMVFRNADGSAEGKGSPGDFTNGSVASNGDIYLDLTADDYVFIVQPEDELVFADAGQNVAILSQASRAATKIRLSVDKGEGFTPIDSVENASELNTAYNLTENETVTFKSEATIDGNTFTDEKSIQFVLKTDNNVVAVPEGLKQGINYNPEDDTKATLVLLAPLKEFVYVIGDFNEWQVNEAYKMNQDPDGERYWLELTGLEAGKEYVFQYLIDGNIYVGDPYADKVADPWNDQFIPESLYPNLPAYDKRENGLATVLQTAQQPYEWTHPEVAGGPIPNEDLVIYELLIRDFIGSHSYKDLTDSLAYLKRLGVNAIQLMPIMEFEGNESWGYNPAYFFAPDKYYGTKNDLKDFINTAHEQGFVVILDMVLNHAFGQNAMVRMYWDEENNKPAANSPWFNPDATHPFNVGYDFNHESQYTKDFSDDVNLYWLEEYKFDGYRFDLSKGFTQVNNINDVGAWSARDESRIALLKRMADVIWASEPNAYVILEHFADNSEETELANYGMMLWGNLNHDYNNAIMGQTGQDLNWTLSSTRGWDNKNLIAYMESHDEERLMVRNMANGLSEGAYDIKEPAIGMERIKMASAFFYTLPGPKMLWQFGELGYDFSINACPPEWTTIENDCRTANKPVPFGDFHGLNYDTDPLRQRLYKATAAIINLVNDNRDVFEEGTFSWTPSGKMRRITIEHPAFDVVIVGNFGLSEDTMDPQFTETGEWFDFFSGEPFEVTDPNAAITLQPGEFHIYTSSAVDFPEPGLVSVFSPVVVTDPVEFRANTSITLTFNATAADPDGTAGLVSADKVYMYAGAVTESFESTEWAYTTGSTDQDDGVGELTPVAGEADKWQITFTPRDYFSVPESESIYRIGMYFRNADGTRVGKGFGAQDIYLRVEPDGQIVSISPAEYTVNDAITITFDAALSNPVGTAGLLGANKVYMHSGIITSGPDGTGWENVVGNWGADDGLGEMTQVAGQANQWEITITPRDYYSIPAGTKVYRFGMVFRNANGSAEGKSAAGGDIFVDLPEITSVENDAPLSDLIVYPNPSAGEAYIKMPEQLGKSANLLIYTMSGQLQAAYEVQPNQTLKLPTQSWQAGLYFIRLNDGRNFATRKLLVE